MSKVLEKNERRRGEEEGGDKDYCVPVDIRNEKIKILMKKLELHLLTREEAQNPPFPPFASPSSL